MTALHNARITEVTSFSAPPEGNKPFEYAYNNYDILYLKGLAANPLKASPTLAQTSPANYTAYPYPTYVTLTVTLSGASAPAEPDNKEGWHFSCWDADFGEITEDLTVTAQYAPSLVGVTPAATVNKLTGKQNELIIVATEHYYDGSKKEHIGAFMKDNNSAGTYEVGPYWFYVDTKGNVQIRESSIVE